MLLFETVVGCAFRKSILSIAYSAVVTLFLIPLTGCADDRAGGPSSSSLSSPTDATSESNSDQTPPSTAADVGGEDPMITMTSTPFGVTANLSWDQPSGFNVAGYTIYYGKRSQGSHSVEATSEESNPEEASAEELGSCSQGEQQAVAAPSTTITGLEANTQYFFAIRASNENQSESICSNTIVVITPPAQA